MQHAQALRADVSTSHEASTFWRPLLYRWFVQYNPAFLLSAAFVFAGCFLWSKGMVHEDSLTSTLGIPLVAEIYAFALIGGAALLTRIGQRRPAVMLGLIALVYQWDTTLHTEACAYLGSIGAWASFAWLVIFAAKLFSVAWALRIRFRRRMIAAALIAALGLAIVPGRLPFGFEGSTRGALLAAWILGLIALYDGSGISSVAPLDAWGQTVLRRVTKAAWLVSGAMLALHVFMWSANFELPLGPTILGLPLLAVPRLRDEKKVWIVILATLTLSAMVMPVAFFAIAILTTGALCLRILDPKISPTVVTPAREKSPTTPYRYGEPIAEVAENKPIQLIPFVLGAAERLRCWSGALFAMYLGVWTMSWTYVDWPQHIVSLDAALTLGVALAVWRTRARAAFLVPLATTYAHAVIQSRLVPVPRSDVALGEAAIGLGFALLGGALLVSYKLGARATPRVDAAIATRQIT